MLEKVDQLKKRSEDLEREAEIAKRQEDEQRRRRVEMEEKMVDVNAKYSSLEEEVQVRRQEGRKGEQAQEMQLVQARRQVNRGWVFAVRGLKQCKAFLGTDSTSKQA